MDLKNDPDGPVNEDADSEGHRIKGYAKPAGLDDPTKKADREGHRIKSYAKPDAPGDDDAEGHGVRRI